MELHKTIVVYDGDALERVLPIEDALRRARHAPLYMLASFTLVVMAIGLIWVSHDAQAGIVPCFLAIPLLAKARYDARRIRRLYPLREKLRQRSTYYLVTGPAHIVEVVEQLQRQATRRGYAIEAATLAHHIACLLYADKSANDAAARLGKLAGYN